MIGQAAYHIDKCCTGGTDEDWEAAERIVEDIVDPLVEAMKHALGSLEAGPLREGWAAQILRSSVGAIEGRS